VVRFSALKLECLWCRRLGFFSLRVLQLMSNFCLVILNYHKRHQQLLVEITDLQHSRRSDLQRSQCFLVHLEQRTTIPSGAKSMIQSTTIPCTYGAKCDDSMWSRVDDPICRKADGTVCGGVDDLTCSKVDGPIFSEVDELCVTLSQRARYVV